MDVVIKGKGRFSLNQKDFVAAGGQGKIFRKGNTAFKLYDDIRSMIPVGKIMELARLTLPNIIRPQDVLLDSKATPIGYTMRFLKDSYALCQLFPRAFRERMGVKPAAVLKLVRKLQAVVSHAHSHDILIVDLNEMNFLVDDSFDDVYAIDCDSWQTPGFPATAIMDSIRDPHAKKFSQETDWFSFGIVSFQAIVGIHPFKGKHPKLKTLEERMMKNVSVFNPDVSVPAVCYPFTNIPESYRDWFKAVFEGGKRLPPPADIQAVVAVVRQARIAGSDNFIVVKLRAFAEDIIRFDPITRHAVTEKGVYSDHRLEMGVDGRPPALGATPHGKVIEGGKVDLFNVSQGIPLPSSLLADCIMDYEGRLYCKHSDRLFEVIFLETGTGIFVGQHEVCQVLDHATKLFDGVAIQSVLGACFVSFFPATKTCQQVHLKELDGHRIHDAKFDNGVLMVVAFKAGKYDRHAFRFDGQAYDHVVEHDVGPVGLNFVTLPSGICVLLDEKDELRLFSNRKDSQSSRSFSDPVLDGSMRLFRDGNNVLFSKDMDLYSIEVKKP